MYSFSENELILWKWTTPLRSLELHDLTHGVWDKIAAILQTTFSNAFSWMNNFGFQTKFHLNIFLGV